MRTHDLTYDRVVNAIGARLADDGFTSPADNAIFIKPIHGPWQAWIAIAGKFCWLEPAVGIMNEELKEIYYQANTNMGKTPERHPDTPPLLRIELERLAAHCPACSTEAPWRYQGKTLTPDVADDVVWCLRKYGYPFFEKYASLQALVEGWKERLTSFAFPLFAPIVLIKLGRTNDARVFVENYTRRFPDDELGSEKRKYFKTLFEMLTESDAKPSSRA
ncbi:MAG TPA: hypothetical protein VKR31_12525 [Rhizomicrobium sp.]|nr:hypothetical protein [Rhizomicrobium sp.]